MVATPLCGAHAWGEDREKVVHEIVDEGFVANLTIVNNKHLPSTMLGQHLTKELASEIVTHGADICGENGEYHTFVSDGPLFKRPVRYIFGEPVHNDGYTHLPVQSIR